MWTYVLWLGFWMLVDPVRIGIAAVLMSRRQALRTLLAFWAGGIIAGVTVGIAVLVLLHDIALGAIKAAAATINDVRSTVTILAGPRLQITLGVLALVSLAVMLARDRARTRIPVTVGGGDALDVLRQPGKFALISNLPSAIGARAQGMLESGFVWPAFVVGLMSTFPPIEGPMVLTVIMGSRAAAGTQFSAFIVFILLVLIFVEVPLVSYLASPEKTQAAMLQMNSWITVHRRQIFETLFAVMGVVSVVQGIGSL